VLTRQKILAALSLPGPLGLTAPRPLLRLATEVIE